MNAKTCRNNQQPGLQKRKRIWEITLNLHCSICGTCFSIEEQRRILKKLEIQEKDYRDYEIHAIFVNSLYQSNKLSYMVNSYLDKKYSYEIAAYGELSEQELGLVWQEKVREGDICGLYWVLLTKADLSEEMLNLVTGEVHMMSHLNGGICRHERMKLKKLEEEKLKLKGRIHQNKINEKSWKSELKAARVCIDKLEKQLQELQSKTIDQVESEPYQQMLDSLKAENDELRSQLIESSKFEDYKKQYRETDKEKVRLARQVLQQKETIIQLCQEIKGMARCQVCCPAGALAGEELDCNKRRLLLVGGNCGLNSYYRDVIENMGWEFRQHDGRLNGGRQSLIERLKWSDLVLCSLDINSHGAVSCVKEYAGKLKKEYRLLDNSSLSSIARVLTEQTGGWSTEQAGGSNNGSEEGRKCAGLSH